MRETRIRSIILSFIIFGFLFGLGLLSFKLFVNSATYALSPINRHLSGNGLSRAGDILDRNNVVLAHSEDEKRLYNQDINIRKALLHTVGDNESHIQTSIQSLYRNELYGYNFIFGIDPPEFLKNSNNIKLTIDSNICKIALNALGNNRGAVCVCNYKTGEIICMVSTPTYDPYKPPVITNDKDPNYEGVYLNRVLSCSFTPGSVFKVVTAACALENEKDAENRIYTCKKIMDVDNKNITCMASHGEKDLKNALMRSCNIYFASLAIDLGKDKMSSFANSLLFNKRLQVDKISTRESSYNVTNSNNYELGWSGVGQYTDLLNPMHSIVILNAIANSGESIDPYLVQDISKSDGTIKYHIDNNINSHTLLTKSTADKLKSMMRYNVQKNYGDSLFPGLNAFAKTGTGETSENKKPNAWIFGGSTNENTPYSFCVVVEDSGFGINVAGPIASTVMKALCKVK